MRLDFLRRIGVKVFFGDEREIEAVRRVFENQRLFRYQAGQDSECVKFEEEFSRANGSKHSLLVSSGTNSLILALKASHIGPGDEVIIPSYTFVATANAVALVGATPVIADINQTLSLCENSAREKISKKTKAIIAVHMDGLSADLGQLKSLADSQNLILIEDAAQAVGGKFKNQALGSFGSFGCFSLNENKIISCGEGGIIVTNNQTLFERAFFLHDGAAQYNPANRNRFSTVEPELGASMRVSEISGAIMRVQLERLHQLLSEFRQRKSHFCLRNSSFPLLQIIRGNDLDGDCGTSIHLMLPDPMTAAKCGRRLRNQGFKFLSPIDRPAHVSWKWKNLGPIGSQQQQLTSLEILSRVLKMDLDIYQDLKSFQLMTEQISQVLQEL